MNLEWSKVDKVGLSKFVDDHANRLLPPLELEDDQIQLRQTKEGRLKIIGAIYDALKKQDIEYALNSYNPQNAKQNIRTSQEILVAPKQGTCLDLALLFCGMCFSYELLPMVIIVEGHAFAAVSLAHQRSEWDKLNVLRTAVRKTDLFTGAEDLEKLKTWIEQGDYVAIECTGFARTQSFGNSQEPEAIGRNGRGFLYFDRAQAAGKEQLASQTRNFGYGIDIAVARYDWGIESEIKNGNAGNSGNGGQSLTSAEQIELKDAIIRAYPNEGNLEMDLAIIDDFNYTAKAQGNTYEERVFKLVQNFEAIQRTADLLKVLVKQRQNNGLFRKLNQKFS